jgi:hypothetical protein
LYASIATSTRPYLHLSIILTKPPDAKDGEVSALYDGNCGPDNAYVPVDDAIACYHYLNSLGAQACSVPENLNAQILCQAGEATITGLGTAQTSEW